MFRKERFDQFGVEFFRDNFFMTRPFVEFHEYMIVARILKRPYFWIQKLICLDEHSQPRTCISHLCRLPENA